MRPRPEQVSTENDGSGSKCSTRYASQKQCYFFPQLSSPPSSFPRTSRAPLLSARSASSNSVERSNTDDGDPQGGRGAALYNYGSDGTVLLKGLATFKDNFGEMVRAHGMQRVAPRVCVVTNSPTQHGAEIIVVVGFCIYDFVSATMFGQQHVPNGKLNACLARVPRLQDDC